MKTNPNPNLKHKRSKDSSSKPRGRPKKDVADIQGSIPLPAEQIAKAILKAPPRSIKNR